jgi:hypothetical protein
MKPLQIKSVLFGCKNETFVKHKLLFSKIKHLSTLTKNRHLLLVMYNGNKSNYS